ncbi:MAG: hypothetical protein DRP45_04175 [Candidatus Zixiibacteriota bacterium]|nr:MAG: hypothetical protein DRP45_04175 [candidate division Zixibacteria bacterium]
MSLLVVSLNGTPSYIGQSNSCDKWILRMHLLKQAVDKPHYGIGTQHNAAIEFINRPFWQKFPLQIGAQKAVASAQPPSYNLQTDSTPPAYRHMVS